MVLTKFGFTDCDVGMFGEILELGKLHFALELITVKNK